MLSLRRTIEHTVPREALTPRVLHVFLLLASMLAISLIVTVSFLRSDWQELLRRAAVMQLRYSLQRNVHLGGLRVNLHGRALLRDLTIYNQPRTRRPLFHAATIDVRFDPLRLTVLPLRPAGAVQRVVVDQPFVAVTRNSKGQWTVQDLLERKGPPSADRFRGEVIVRHGEIIYQDAIGFPQTGPIDEHLTDVALRVNPAIDGYLPFVMTARPRSGHARQFSVTGGINTNGGRTLCDVRFQQANLAFVRRFLPSSVPIAIDSGRADGRWQFTLAPPGTTPRLQMAVVADVRDLRGTLRLPDGNFPCVVSQGQFRMAPNVLEFADMQATVDGVSAEFDGTVSHFMGTQANPVLALQMRTRQADGGALSRLVPGLSALPMVTWSGRADAWAQITGTVSAPEVVAHVSGIAVSGKEFGDLTDIACDLQVRDKTLAITHLTAAGYGGRVAGNAWVSLDSDAKAVALFHGEMARADAHAVMQQFVPADAGRSSGNTEYSLRALTGTLSGPLTIEVTKERPQGPPAVTVVTRCQGDASLAELSGQVDASLRIDARDGKARITIDRLAADTPAGALQAQGSVGDDGTLDLAVRGSRLDLAHIGALANRTDLTGAGYVDGRVSGPVAAPAFRGRIYAQRGSFAGRQFSDLSGEVQAEAAPAPRIAIENAHLVAGENHFEGNLALTGPTQTDQPWEIGGALTMRRTTVTALKSLLGIDLPLEGFAEGTVDFDHLADAPNGRGSLTMLHPVLHLPQGDVRLDRAAVEFQLHGSTVEIANAVLIYQGSPIAMTGTVEPGKQFRLQVQAPLLSAGSLPSLVTVQTADGARQPLFSPPVGVQGTLALEATVSGRMDADPNEPLPQRIARTLQVAGTIASKDTLMLSGLDYRDLSAAFSFNGQDGLLGLERFSIVRDDPQRRYTLALASPSSIRLSNQELDLHLAMRDPDLDDLRRDLLDLDENAGGIPAMAPVLAALKQVPLPIAGTLDLALNLTGALQRPVVASTFSLDKVVLGGNTMPDIDGAVTLDTAPGELRIERLAAKGGPDPDAEATLVGSMTLPVRDALGQVKTAGAMNLSLQAWGLSLGLLGGWSRNPALRGLSGEAEITGQITGTTSDPEVLASLDVRNPVVNGVPFDSLSTAIQLQDDKLWIGNKALAAEQGAGQVQFKGADKALEVFGYLPVRWIGTLHPTVPVDKDLYLTVRLPRQGLGIVRAYVPDLPAGDGAIEGALEVRGTLAKPQLVKGSLIATAAELRLAGNTDADLPNRLRQAALNLGFHSDPDTGVNTIMVNDLSATYDRDGETPTAKKPPVLVRWLNALLGKNTPVAPPVRGTVVVRGAIRTDPRRPLFSDGKLLPITDIPEQLDYDLYAKMLRAPLRWKGMYQGTVTSYLHLGNRPDRSRKPLLSGVIYAERSHITFAGKEKEAVEPLHLPLNPDLSIALQIGPGNIFSLEQSNPIFQNALSADLPFQPTDLFAPFSQADTAWMAQKNGTKPPMETDHFAYRYNGGVMYPAGTEPVNGTHGQLTGTLAQPHVTVDYVLEPGKAEVRLPGGILTVDEGSGRFVATLGDPDSVSLTADAKATTFLDDQEVSATIAGDLLHRTDDRLPIAFSAPPTQRSASSLVVDSTPTSQNDIYSRLFGLTDLRGYLSGDKQLLASLGRMGPDMFVNSWLGQLTKRAGLPTLSASVSSTMYPELSIRTMEFGRSHWGSFRLGGTHTFSTPPTWDLWLAYRVPQYRFLKDVSLRVETNDRNDHWLNLQYGIEF